MAFTSVETIIANPARKGKRNVARMSLKQRLHFGSKAQRAAAKRSLSGRRKKNTARPHRKRTVARRRANPPKARKRVQRPRVKKAQRRSNPGEIISLALNPAKRRTKVAATKRRRKAARRTNAGHRATSRTRRKGGHRPRRRAVCSRGVPKRSCMTARSRRASSWGRWSRSSFARSETSRLTGSSFPCRAWVTTW